jgi:hypothetical protein
MVSILEILEVCSLRQRKFVRSEASIAYNLYKVSLHDFLWICLL